MGIIKLQSGGLSIGEVEKAIPKTHKWGMAYKPINVVQYATESIKDLASRGVDIPQSLKEGVMVLPEYTHYDTPEEATVSNRYKELTPGRIGTCDETGCSERARVVLANTLGKDLNWAVGQGMVYSGGDKRNNAWDVEHNLINAGGKSIYSYADKVGGSFKEKPFDDWKNYDVKVGDMVGLHNNDFTENPVNTGKSVNKSRHVGVVTGYDKDGVPMVRHNIHGKEYLEPINKISSNINHFANYYVHSITRPKDLVDKPLDIESHNKEIRGLKFDPSYDPNYTDTEKKFISGINDSKKEVMQLTGMSEEDYAKYGQLAFGILQMESKGDREDDYSYLQGKNMASGFRQLLTGEEPSKGWTQLKHYPQDSAKKLGLTNLLDPRDSAIATILSLHEKDKRLAKHPDYKDKDRDYYLAGSHKNDLGFKKHAVGKSSGLLNYRNKSYDADNYNLDYANKVMQATSRLRGAGIVPLWDKYKPLVESTLKEKPMMVDKQYILKSPARYQDMSVGQFNAKVRVNQSGGVLSQPLAKQQFKSIYGKYPSGASDYVKVADIQSNPSKYGMKAGMLPSIEITAKSEVEPTIIGKHYAAQKEKLKSNEMVGGKANPTADKMEPVDWEMALMPSRGLSKVLLSNMAKSRIARIAVEGIDMIDPTSMGMGLAKAAKQYEVKPIKGVASMGFPFEIRKKVDSQLALPNPNNQFNPEIKEYKDNYEMFKDFNEQGKKQGIVIDRDSDEYQDYLANAHKSREYYVGRDIEMLKPRVEAGAGSYRNLGREGLKPYNLEDPLDAKSLGFLHGERLDDWKNRQLALAYKQYTPEWLGRKIDQASIDKGLGIDNPSEGFLKHLEEDLTMKPRLHKDLKSLSTEREKLINDSPSVSYDDRVVLSSSGNPDDISLLNHIDDASRSKEARLNQLKANEAMIKSSSLLTKLGIKENPYKEYLKGSKQVGDWVSPSNRLSNEDIADGLWLSKRSPQGQEFEGNVVSNNYEKETSKPLNSFMDSLNPIFEGLQSSDSIWYRNKLKNESGYTDFARKLLGKEYIESVYSNRKPIKSMNREHLGKWDLTNPDWHKALLPMGLGLGLGYKSLNKEDK